MNMPGSLTPVRFSWLPRRVCGMTQSINQLCWLAETLREIEYELFTGYGRGYASMQDMVDLPPIALWCGRVGEMTWFDSQLPPSAVKAKDNHSLVPGTSIIES